MKGNGSVFGFILRRWFVVLICAAIGAGALYVEKTQVAPSSPVNGDLLYARLVRLDPMPEQELPAGMIPQEGLSSPNALLTWRAQESMMADLGNAMDIGKLCTEWGTLKLSDRITWVNTHIHIIHMGQGMYEMEVQFRSTDAKDADYIREHAGLMMDTLAASAERILAPHTNGARLVTVDSFSLESDGADVTQRDLSKKYAIIGFVLGALIGMAVLAVLSLRRKES